MDEFYMRYYVGHKGPAGHEYLEFELFPSGKLQYANYCKHSNNPHIQQEVYVSPAVVEEVKRMISESTILTDVDDANWPEPRENEGRHELECKVGLNHIAFTAKEIKALADVERSSDPAGLRIFHRLTQDIKELSLTLINCHFKAKPIPI
ncbi:protein mago nashi [Fistulifera solaris]|uniref:Protein mago nashi n=1 Tax=Fistulifera solaris TaxID=1519565 RepID=A0A1Z5JL11_FISSO|nr:protein mago nashi [Fistulifera solaris]|eukprot:GAX14542.1 protein mago nashi [Fistulifera solaris]